MLPTWVGVVGALALAVIALAAIAVAVAVASVALGIRTAVRQLEGLLGPALADVRQLAATARAEVEGLAALSRDLRGRAVHLADAAALRLAALDAIVTGLEDELRTAAEDLVGALRALRQVVSLINVAEFFRSRRRRARAQRDPADREEDRPGRERGEP